MLFSVSEEGVVALRGGRTVLNKPGCGVTGFPGCCAGSVLTELGDGVVVMVVVEVVVEVVVDVLEVVEVFTVEGEVVFKVSGFGLEAFPDAGGLGGAAVFNELIRVVEIFPAGGEEESVLGGLEEGVGVSPESGVGFVLTELGLGVVVVFLMDGGATVFPDVGGTEVFLGCGVFGGRPGGGRGGGGLADGGDGFILVGLGLEGDLGFFALMGAAVFLVVVMATVVVVVVVVVVVLAEVVGLAVVVVVVVGTVVVV